jgi:hypothetical protein
LSYKNYRATEISLIKKNRGVTFNGFISMYSNFFNDIVSVSFSGIYNNPNYTLQSKSVSYPYLDFSVSTNFFKEKLGVSLYVQNMLGNNATTIRSTSYADNFRQTSTSRDNLTNLLISLTYNFGKKFDNYMNEDDIQNDDVRK